MGIRVKLFKSGRHKFYYLMSIPSSYNPSDYEYLLRSLSEGSHAAKAEALKRFQILAGSDKKQFSVYAKRIILAMQDLMSEPKEEIDIYAAMLVLEIINLNPKDIEYYIKTKLLKKVILNLGDSKPQLRKTSHYAILAFIKTFKNIDEVLNLYSEQAISSPEPQLKQKAINSFQSIVITDSSALNWNSPEFKKMFELLLQKLKDPSPFVQKASQQCLLTLAKMSEVHMFSKKLPPPLAGVYKAFCDNQRQLGNLQSIHLESENHPGLSRPGIHSEHSKSEKSLPQNNDRLKKITKQDAINKQALIQKIEELRRNSQVPLNIPDPLVRQKELREEKQRQKLVPLFSHRAKDDGKDQKGKRQGESNEKKIHPVIFATKGQKLDNVFGRKLFEDLKNDKDWKVRLEAIEELASKFQTYKEAIQPEVLITNLLPPLIKLLSDQNFKISTITLKVFEQFLRIPQISLETVAPQIVQKLADGKVVLRQGIARLIRSEYLRLYNPIWIDSLLELMKKAPNPILKEEILSILIRLYEDEVVRYPFQKIISLVCPLMDDPKTKVKIRTLDLLVKISISTHKIDAIKMILNGKLNQVYYEMYLEKVNMENKQRVTPRLTESEPPPRGESRSLSFPSLRKHNNSANNTTSTSLQKYSKTVDTKPINRGNSDLNPVSNLSYNTHQNTSEYDQFELTNRASLTPHESVRKKPVKNSYKKRIQKSIETKLSITHTADAEGLRPFSDPEKELKNLANQLKSEDWQSAFDALTKLRRLLKFHPETLNPSISRPLIVETAKLVQSLRSSLSKNAVITLGECAEVLKNALDAELDNIFSRLMRKTLDTNSFISEEVKKTMTLVSTNCSESKVLSILINYHTSRAIPIKVSIVSVLEAIILEPRVIEKESEKIVSILVDFMAQGALQIRDRSKALLAKLLDEDKRGKIVKLIPTEILNKFRKAQEGASSASKLVKETSIMSIPSIKQPQMAQKEEVLAPPKKKIVTFPKQFDELEELLLNCETGQWKVRQVSLSKVASLVKTYPIEITQHRLSTRVIQMFAKHSNDPNTKVSTSALTLFTQIVPLVPKLIESNLSVLSNELFSGFASQRSEVRDLSLHLFDQIATNIENWMLVQHLCTGVLYGPAKAKANTLFKIITVLPTAMREKRGLVQKHVYALINKMAEDSKGDIVPVLRQLIKVSLSLGGEEAFAALKQPAKSLAES